MSKINAVRFININYNHNANRISDETFHFNGESTLLSLRNGGGKSVLVQMMIAPFVHKRYRDAKDRPFEGYFTTGKPSFILTEWILDRGAGYVLAGMMVRKALDGEESSGESLEMVNFISEYQNPCLHDIHHLPVVEKGKREIVLKNFGACRQIFEGYKKDRGMRFFYYDMGNAAQSRQYFDKLLEYQINYKEWEGIIKKVNLKESGLSDLFADCRDERGLVEKWFLDAVETKLNKDKNRMKEFQSILEKYVGQYKDNQSKIKRRDMIRIFWQEAEGIKEKNQNYLEMEGQVKEQAYKIAGFRQELEELHSRTTKEEKENGEQVEELQQEISLLEYQKLSQEYYQLEEKKLFHAGSREMLFMEKEDLEQEIGRIQRKLHVLACAKQQAEADGEKAEWEQARQRLAVAKERNRDLEPERNGLGYLLRTYYQQDMEEIKESLGRNQQESRRIEQELAGEQETLAGLEEALRKNALAMGELKSDMQGYDRQEQQFNTRYQEQLTRNILGEYEPGSLEVFGEICQKTLEESVRKKSAKGRELEQAKEQSVSLEHKLIAQKEERAKTLAKKEQQIQLKESYEKELSKRRAILKYLELEESHLFHEEKIYQAADHKLKEIEIIRRNLEQEEYELQKEYQRLTEGKVLELAPELLEEFEQQGIHIVFGMEWLKKNGYSKKKNQELVKKHPFLPYALILSEGELEKLSQFQGEVPTAFPIPMILRKSLDQQGEPEAGNVLDFPGLSFYLLFNQNLLDEEKLKQLVARKQQQMERVQEQLAVRSQEYQEYFSWKEQVKNQKVCEESYQENQNKTREFSSQLETLEQEIHSKSQELSKNREKRDRLEQEIRSAEKETEGLQQKYSAFQELQAAYGEYQENRRKQEKRQKEEQQYTQEKKLSRLKLQKLQENRQSLQNLQIDLERKREQRQEKLRVYQGYKKASRQELTKLLSRQAWTAQDTGREASGQDIGKGQLDLFVRIREILPELEARYAAVTATVSQKIRELESLEQHSSRRYQKAREELSHLAGKYKLLSKDWQSVSYSRREETDLELLLEDRNRKLKEKEGLWNQEDKQAALFHQQMQDRVSRMQKEYAKEKPLSKEEIPKEDFESRKNQLCYQYQELQKTGKMLQTKRHSYDENLTALAEYRDFVLQEPIVWETEFSAMDTRELRNFKGILVRDYNQLCNGRQEAREKLVRLLNQVVRMGCFQEDFYRKPLEAMLELSGDAVQVQRQLETTLQSYQSLMEKLEVDISLVEREKDKIVDLLEDYLLEVHKSLGKIDQNSTIAIRERPVKMLKIKLPSWEENQGLYRLRLQDFIKELTEKGIAIFQQNENAQEYFGTQLTTRNLYDTVVGIGNVQIRLYKIEEQREYPITWAEVARNSGGEGFLSAFVVLSSLLYFMRRDDTDLFADKNEGKVLVMDNPFAQTNAAHLLKPLMDMARKTNTQLICLTGLGGESIYSRFDNIYVLNLVSASLRQGMQYLKSEHLQGTDPDTIITTQIEVVEQQELEF